MRDHTTTTLPCPVHEPHTANLPAALTIFLTRSQRARVVRALSTIHPDRTQALLAALGIDSKEVRS